MNDLTQKIDFIKYLKDDLKLSPEVIGKIMYHMNKKYSNQNNHQDGQIDATLVHKRMMQLLLNSYYGQIDENMTDDNSDNNKDIDDNFMDMYAKVPAIIRNSTYDELNSNKIYQDVIKKLLNSYYGEPGFIIIHQNAKDMEKLYCNKNI